MNKKEARRKNHEAERKKKQDILDSRIIGADDEDFDDVEIVEGGEEETLLGNLAPVKQIPVLPWRLALIFPLNTKTFNLAAEADNWLVELFREISEKDDDLIGFLPIVNLEEKSMNAVLDTLETGLGIAMQVKEVKTTEIGTNRVKLQAICRFEVTGYALKSDKYSNVNVRWFEDDEEPDEILRPLYDRHLEIVHRISKMKGKELRFYQDMATYPKYNRQSAKYASFMFIDSFEDWFTRKEQIELLFLTSTAERYQRVYERAMKKLPALDNKWTIERRTKNN